MFAHAGRLWILVGLLAAGCARSGATPRPHPPVSSPARVSSPRRPPAERRRTLVLGRSVRGRPITATVLGDPRAPRRLLVVGAIHGNEPAGIRIAQRLLDGRAAAGWALWVVADLNPDGVAMGTRQNARGVDLNRNFPYAWQPLGSRGAVDYSGPMALSEPESRLATALILRIRPAIAIWFHQHQAVTDASGGDIRIERRFAMLSRLPLVHLTRYPGSAAGWQDHRLPGTTAFVVELPAGEPSRPALRRYVHAVDALTGPVPSRTRR